MDPLILHKILYTIKSTLVLRGHFSCGCLIAFIYFSFVGLEWGSTREDVIGMYST